MRRTLIHIIKQQMFILKMFSLVLSDIIKARRRKEIVPNATKLMKQITGFYCG